MKIKIFFWYFITGALNQKAFQHAYLTSLSSCGLKSRTPLPNSHDCQKGWKGNMSARDRSLNIVSICSSDVISVPKNSEFQQQLSLIFLFFFSSVWSFNIGCAELWNIQRTEKWRSEIGLRNELWFFPDYFGGKRIIMIECVSFSPSWILSTSS